MNTDFINAIKSLAAGINVHFSPGGKGVNDSYNITSTRTNLFDFAEQINRLSSNHGLTKNYMNSNSAEYVKSPILKR